MEFWAAFLLGLLGSLHCAGMCGPLALALPNTGGSAVAFGIGRITYNLGRVTAYCILGVFFGLLGQTVALAGFQRWASLAAGVAVILALAPASRHGLSLPALRAVAILKAGLASLLRQRSMSALYLLGVLNGFLPCGLVYVACAGAVAIGSIGSGVAYMFAFGLGTIPLMLGIGFAGRNVQLTMRVRYQKLVPICLAVVGTLLVLRGMSLGIPYISPDLSAGLGAHPSCH